MNKYVTVTKTGIPENTLITIKNILKKMGNNKFPLKMGVAVEMKIREDLLSIGCHEKRIDHLFGHPVTVYHTNASGLEISPGKFTNPDFPQIYHPF